MTTQDLISKSGIPDLIDFSQVTASVISPPYEVNVIVDTSDCKSFLFQTYAYIKNIDNSGDLSVSGYLNLEESDNPTTGFTQIPEDRLNILKKNMNFTEDPNVDPNGYISGFMELGAYGNKRYVKVGIYVEASRSIETQECYIATLVRKKNFIYKKSN